MLEKPYRAPGELATLRCDYDLGNDTLYAVKWYKDHEEFYRFVPKARPQKNWYKVDGVHVDPNLANDISKKRRVMVNRDGFAKNGSK
nr:unnamed protein product [Callosobruchus chinensis]